MLQETVAQLRKAEKDEEVKAVLLKIDSPGGTVTASDIIYNELQHFKEKTKAKIVVIMMDVAASGGYYISLPADYIIAHPTTITGSVGVMFPRWQASGLMEKIGVRHDVSKSGKYKDMGSPFRETTEEEKKLFQNLTDGLNDRFITLVKKHRNLDPKKLEEVATAKVFIAKEALDKGLIDQVGYLNEAVDKAKTIAGLSKDAKVIAYRRTEQPDDNLYNTSTSEYSDKQPSLVHLDLLEGLPPRLKGGFYYIWPPGISN
jgi:protease-4